MTTTTAPVRISAPLPPVPPAPRRLIAIPDDDDLATYRITPRGYVPADQAPPVPSGYRIPLPPTDADDCARGPIVAPSGRSSDPTRRALDVVDDTAPYDFDPVGDGHRCDTCRGFGLVRANGKRAGQHYRSVNGAQTAMANGNAVDCPTCDGLGMLVLADTTAVSA